MCAEELQQFIDCSLRSGTATYLQTKLITEYEKAVKNQRILRKIVGKSSTQTKLRFREKWG
jgi:hypothetical protein